MNIDKTVYSGRPENCAGRAERETACYDLLDQLGLDYTRVDHAPETGMADCADIEALLGTKICKNLVLTNRQKTQFYLLLMAWDKPFKTKDLSKQIGSARLSFASEEDMERLLQVAPNSSSILGMMNDKDHQVKLLLDQPIAQAEHFGCHPCVNTTTLRLSMAQVREKFLPYLGVEPIVVDLPDPREETE
jgi:Ala-tRNA(Pro) deacylase